jgi:Ca-activated chloride channel family protein
VKEKAEARRDYEAALADGRAATLLEEDKPTLFTLSVANIAPGAVIEVELAYQDLLPYDEGRWGFAFPMVAPPRYLDAAPTAPRRRDESRAADVAVTVRFPDAESIHALRCTSHLVAIDAHPDGGTRVRLRADGPLANRDFMLDWRAAEEGVRPWVYLERHANTPGTFLLALTPSQPKATTERAGGAGDFQAIRCGNCGGAISDLSAIKEIPGLGPVVPCAYCGAVLAPGTDVVTRPVRPRDVLVLVDRSASMRGAEAVVRRALEAIVTGLAPGDAAQVVVFDHDRAALDGEGGRFLAPSPELVAHALKLLDASPPRGGSELEDALGVSAKIAPREGRSRVVVLVSDVSVGNEARLFRRLPELLGAGAKLFVLGVGASLDRRLARRLARAGGGAMEGVGEAETLARFVRRVREAGPVLTDLTLWWEGAAVSELMPARVPDLYSGEALRVLGRFTGTGPTTLVLTGTTAGGKSYRQELAVKLPTESAEVPGLERAWARRRVEALAERAERVPGDTESAREGLALALRWSIVSRWTSLVAEDKAVSVAPRRAQKGQLLDERGIALLWLDATRRTVGRAIEADLQLSDGSVSRLHAEFVFDGEHFVVRDLASANGTRVNGVITREAPLTVGTVLEVGAERFRFALAPPERPESWFEFVPTQRAVDARDGASARRSAVVAAPEMPRPSPLGPMPPLPGAPPPMPMGAMPGGPPPMGAMPGGPPPMGAMPGGPPPMGAMPGGPPPMGAMPGGPPPMGAMPAPMRPAPAMPRAMGPMPALAPPPMGPMPTGFAPSPAMASEGYAPPRPMGPMPAGFAPPPSGYAPPPPSAARPMPPAPAAPVQAIHAPVRSSASEPYPEHELRWLSTRVRGELDLAIVIDATGSMGAHIAEVRARLLDLVDALRASPLCRDLRLAVVAYRDHPPQEMTFITRVTPFTGDIAAVRAVVSALEASGGGDGPEAVTDGLYDLVRLAWRPGAARAAVWFGDAPPHGVEPSRDAFPQGCPCGHHWYTQAESCREMGIAVYAVGCLPTLRAYVGAEKMYREVARATRGMYLPLREAALLVPLIAGAAETALDGQRLDAYLEALLAQEGGMLAGVDGDERVRWATARFRAEGLRARAMDFGSESAREHPMRFREVTPVDIRASFARLMAAGRWVP